MPTLLGFFGAPGWVELVIVGGVVLLLFGNRLPSVMRSMGIGITEFRKGVQGIEDDDDSPSNSRLDEPKETKEETKEEIKEETKEAIEDVTSAYDETDEIDEYLVDGEVVLDDTEKETSRTFIGLFILIVGLISAYLVYSYLDDQKKYRYS